MELLTPYLAKYAHLMGPPPELKQSPEKSDNIDLDALNAWLKTNL